MADFRARVRMYRHGLGDCLLVTLPRTDGSGDYYIMIDCGVLLGTKDAAAEMTRVVQDVIKTTDGHVHLLLATHEHWDHVSGFLQAEEAFKDLDVDRVWLGWPEDPADPLAQELSGQLDQALSGLQLSAARLQLDGDTANANLIGSLIEFFGVAGRRTTRSALERARGMGRAAPRYCRPEDAPVAIPEIRARLYVLGPPRDVKQIRKTSPGTRDPETYGLSLALQAFDEHAKAALEADAEELPFSTMYTIPYHVAAEMDYFSRYWAADDWRRIDGAWLAGTSELALQLDASTNNTSLVLAIELVRDDDQIGDVLLFAADAQVGNWLSWQDLKWNVGDRVVTGPDLIDHTVLYKVGHHGSHNATLKEKGLQQMDNLKLALIPVFKEMAMAKGWGSMPLPELVDALKTKTRGALLQSDQPVPGTLPRGYRVRQSDVVPELYYEVEVL